MNPARCLHKLPRRPLQRCLFSSAPPEEDLEWPLLVRRAREAVEDDTRLHTRRPRTLSSAEKARSKLEKAHEMLDGILKGSIARPGKPKWKPRVEPMAPLAAPSSAKLQHPRLLVSGLSANVRLADFYRVQGNGLSGWNADPTEVYQDRDAITLEPTGAFVLTFRHPDHLEAYQNTLESSSALSHGSKADLRRRKPASNPPVWTERLRDIIHMDGFGDKPPVVMMHADPPALGGVEMRKLIQRDGTERGTAWRVSRPHHLTRHRTHLTKPGDEGLDMDDHRTNGKWGTLRSRFIVSCEDGDEARRFQRRWNQAIIDGGEFGFDGQMITVTTSLVEW